MAARALIVPLLLLLLQQVTAIKDLLHLDCDGGLHILSETHFEAHFNLEAVFKAANFVFSEAAERARCDCPQITDEEIQRRFLPTLEAMTCTWLHVKDPQNPGKYMVNPCAKATACPDASFPKGLLNNNDFMRGVEYEGLLFPETCSYESVMNGEGCKFRIAGGANLTLVDEGTFLDVQLHSCGVGKIFPSISVTCEEGSGCEDLFIKECTEADMQNEDITCRKFWGETVFDRFNVLHRMGLVPADMQVKDPQCLADMMPDLPSEYRNAFLQYVANFLPASLKPSSGNFMVTGRTAAEWVDLIDTIRNLEPGSFLDTLFTSSNENEEPEFDTTEVTTIVSFQDVSPPGFDVSYCLSIGCHPQYLGNGMCNPTCNVPQCLEDFGECKDCECVSGTDSTTCSSQDLRNGVGGDVDPESCSVVQPDEPCVPTTPGNNFDWVCTHKFGPLSPNLVGKVNEVSCPPHAGENYVAAVRHCWCGQSDVSCGHLYSLKGPQNQCVGPPPPEVCPFKIRSTDLSRYIKPLNAPARKTSGMEVPKFKPQYENVFYMTCEGLIGMNLLNENLAVGLYMPNLPSLVQGFELAFWPLYQCMTNSNNREAFTMRYQIMRAELWLDALVARDEPSRGLDAVANRDDFFNEYGEPSGDGDTIDLASNIAFPWRESFSLSANERVLLKGATNFSLGGFLDNGYVRGAFTKYDALLEYPFEIQLEVKKCSNNILSQVAVAVKSDYNALWETPLPCTENSDCGPGLDCIDLTTNQDTEDRWFFQPVINAMDDRYVDEPYAEIIFGRNPRPAECSNDAKNLQSANKFMETVVAGRSFNGDAVFSSHLRRCGKPIEKLYDEELVEGFFCSITEETFILLNLCNVSCLLGDCDPDEVLSPYGEWVPTVFKSVSEPVQQTEVEGWIDLPNPVPFVDVPSPAPGISSIRWSAKFSSLLITFDQFTNQGGQLAALPQPCKLFMDFIGDISYNHVCNWLDPTRLEVLVPGDSTLSLEGFIRFKTGNNIRNKDGNSFEMQTVARLIDPAPHASGFQLNVDLVVPESVSECQGKLFIPTQVTNGGARPLRDVTWSLGGRVASDCTGVCLLENTFADIPQGSDSSLLLDFNVAQALIDAEVEPGHWAPGHYFVIRFRGKNWVNNNEYAAFAKFQLTATPSISVSLSGGASQTVNRGKEYRVEATTYLPATCYNTQNINDSLFTYTWKLTCDGSELVIPGVNYKARELVIPRGTLPKGVPCGLEVDVTSPAQVSGRATQTLIVVSNPMIAVIKGGSSRQVLRSDSFALDATRSCNPNLDTLCSTTVGNLRKAPFTLSPTIRFTWECKFTQDGVGGGNCALSPPDSSKSTWDIPRNTLIAGALYEFSVSVDDNADTSASPAKRFVNIKVVSASVEAQVTCERPQVSIFPVPSVVNGATSGLRLRGDITGSPETLRAVVPLWQLMSQDDTPLPVKPLVGDNPINRNNLVIVPNSLVGGREYRFRLTATLSCVTSDASSYDEVMFTVNSPPSGGLAKVSPRIGSALDTFLLEANQFVDLENNLPLKYAFFIRFADPETVTGTPGKFKVIRKPSQISDFSITSILSTPLPLPPPESRGMLEVLVVAEDSLGARSIPDASKFLVQIVPPFAYNSTEFTNINIADKIDEVRLQGGSEEAVLRAAISYASVTNGIDATGTSDVTVDTWSKEARSTLIQSIVKVRDNLQGLPNLSPSTLALEANTLAVVLLQPESVSKEDRNTAIELASSLLSEARTRLADLSLGEDDPSAGSQLPGSFAADTLFALSLLAESVKKTLDDATALVTDNGNSTTSGLIGNTRKLRGRLLDETEQAQVAAEVVEACESLFEIRVLLESLPSVTLLEAVPGQVSDQVDGSVVRLRAAREDSGSVGQDQGLQSVNIDDGIGEGVPTIRLPRNVLNGQFINRTEAPEQVNVVVLQWAFNVRCDNESNTFEDLFGEQPPLGTDEEECDPTEFARSRSFKGPLTTIANVVSVEFINSQDTQDKLTVQGLEDDFVEIKVSIPDYLLTGDIYCGESTAPSCGYYDEVIGWTSQGCNVTTLVPEEGYLVCQCNHASDYSAWQSFVKDLSNTLYSPVTITALGILVLGILFPMLLLVWFVLVWWSKNKDLNESDHIQRGALVMLLLTRVQNQHRQREFFRRLKLMRDGAVSLNDDESNEKQDTDSEAPKPRPGLLSQTSQILNTAQRTGTRKVHVLKNWCLALRYDHSVFGLIRFDPHYTRLQRVCVLMAVVMGNLFVAAFFFELKAADDISTGFLVGIVLASALIVSIPIRFFVKILFRGSAPKSGSKMERAAQVFRMTQNNSDTPKPEDLRLVFAYRDLYRAKLKLNRLKADGGAAESSTGSWSYSMSSLLARGKHDSGSQALIPSKPDLRAPSVSSGAIDEESDDQPKQRRSLKTAATTLARDIEKAETDYKLAKASLVEATKIARAAWKLNAPPSQRKLAVKRQKSLLLKIAAVVGEEEPRRPKSRNPMFSRFAVYVGWVMLLLFYGLSTFYSVRFILTRASVSAEQLGEGATQVEVQESELNYVTSWLITSASGILVGYFVLEPILQFLRFSVMPWVILKFGSQDSSLKKVEAGSVRFEEIEKMEVGGAASFLESTTDFLLDFSVEVIEGLF